ncbi:MAG TPA: hypothetical protein VMH39_08075, partial [Gemmatimonadaceae bacterium]|nr:hypothetical protein [Gemmatimonadaceae bacterium]
MKAIGTHVRLPAIRRVCSTLLAVAAGAGIAPLGAQAALATAAEGRASTGGVAVISISAHAKVAVVSTRGANALVTVEGWVDASRLAGKLDTFPASVDARGTLRIRATPEPGGTIIAELHSRVGVRTLAKSGKWVRVTRSAWIPAAALAAAPSPAKPKSPAAAAPAPPASAPRVVADTPAVPGAMAVAGATSLLAAPEGKPVASVAAGAIVQQLAHDHGWSKVRVEGWVPDRQLVPADTSLGSQLTAADLRADPDATRGKMVQWEVQVLSLQTADPLRPEL